MTMARRQDGSKKFRCLRACECGDIETVRELVETGSIDPNWVSEIGYSSGHRVKGLGPLHLSCGNGHVEVVELLLTNLCLLDVNAGDKNYKKTPLHYACENGHLKVVQFLLTHSTADVSATDINGWTPLHLACLNGHLNVVDFLLLHSTADANARDGSGRTPLHYACEWNKLTVVEYLVNHTNSKVNVKDNIGDTPLRLARREFNVEVVSFLERHIYADTSSSCELQLVPDKTPSLDELTMINYNTDEGENQKIGIIAEASCKWKDIADLICDDYDIGELEQENHGDPEKCLRQIFIDNFINKKPQDYTQDWNGLIQLLDDVGLETLSLNIITIVYYHCRQ